MILEEFFKDIKSSFCALWQAKTRGDSLEIITPYATINNRFISVFLTKRGEDFVITDGGWLKSGIYDVFFKDDEYFEKVFTHFFISLGIKETKNTSGKTFFYLKTNNEIDIPSKLLDITIFIQSVINICEIEFVDKVETDNKKRFQSKANDYLKTALPNKKLSFSTSLGNYTGDAKFNAIFKHDGTNISIINYVTGSSHGNFLNSISKTNMLFEIATTKDYRGMIKSMISFVDTDAEGYNVSRVYHYIDHLKNNTSSKIVTWEKKEEIIDILA